jgi:hypothetical protein
MLRARTPVSVVAGEQPRTAPQLRRLFESHLPLRSLNLSDQPAAYPLLMQTPSALAASHPTLTSLCGLILTDLPEGRRRLPPLAQLTALRSVTLLDTWDTLYKLPAGALPTGLTELTVEAFTPETPPGQRRPSVLDRLRALTRLQRLTLSGPADLQRRNKLLLPASLQVHVLHLLCPAQAQMLNVCIVEGACSWKAHPTTMRLAGQIPLAPYDMDSFPKPIEDEHGAWRAVSRVLCLTSPASAAVAVHPAKEGRAQRHRHHGRPGCHG